MVQVKKRPFSCRKGQKVTLKQQRGQRCYLAVVDDRRSKLFPRLCVVKGSTCFADLDQQGLPLGEVFTQTVVDVLSLHVPQALVLEPNLDGGNERVP